MEIGEIFSAEPKASWKLLCENAIGFYVPPYQRPYTWDKSNLFRLLEDACHGLRQLTEAPDAITFIGTLILIHDTKHNTIKPHVKGQLPAGVMLVIDGQQRLTSLLLLNTCLHEEITRRGRSFSTSDDPCHEWLFKKTLEVTNQLAQTYEEDKHHGEGNLQWYPRMIRAYDDSWSREAATAQYKSPLARHLAEYGAHTRAKVKVLFKPSKLKDASEDDKSKHAIISNNRTYLRKTLLKYTSLKASNLDFIQTDALATSDHLHSVLFNSDFPDYVKDFVLGADSDDSKQTVLELLRIICFAKFVLERMTVTVVIAKSEDYAFDMFEALNTTGEPLTAFETFKPQVVSAEGLKGYEGSSSQSNLAIVEQYLNVFKNAQERQRATNNLLLPFAMAETGEAIAKRLSDQRRYLRKCYEEATELKAKRAFAKHMADVSVYLRKVWLDDDDDRINVLDSDIPDRGLVMLCIDMLKKSGHDITVGPLANFFAKLRSAEDEERLVQCEEFGIAVKAVAAFFAIWRSTRIGTENIDSHYRTLMQKGYDGVASPFARSRGEIGLAKISSDTLQTAFRHVLSEKGGIGSEDEFVRLAKELPVHKQSATLAKFLLFAATHDTCRDEAHPGLIKEAREDSLDLLSWDQWSLRNHSVEHIAPQSQPAGWDATLYEPIDIEHSLGNLTLLPLPENSSVGNRVWDEKKLYYRILSAPSADILDSVLAEASKRGIEIGESTKDILRDARFHPQLRAVAEVPEWTIDIVKQRGERMAQLIWKRISPWLGF